MNKLDSSERMLIQACLAKKMSLGDIARRMGRNKSTISREISNHLIIVEGYNEKPCIHTNKYFVCNICPMKGTCSHTKRYYNFEKAEYETTKLRKSARSKTQLNKDKINLINNLITEEIRELKQSLHHAYIANPILTKICSERTIRRLIYRGELKIKAHELRKYVVYKHDYEKGKNFYLKDVRVIIGRQFNDYLKYVNKHKRMNIVQYDSVIGKITDEVALLTITFPKYEFQFGILIKKGDPNNVKTKIKYLFKRLGSEFVKEIFPINLSDNGIEFSYFNEIETNDLGERLCRTFYTNPYKATDKPHCERYHELIRYFIPKGKSLNFLTQDKVDWMFSQINSYVRAAKGNQTPYDLVKRKFGSEFLKAINIQRVDKRKVSLRQIC